MISHREISSILLATSIFTPTISSKHASNWVASVGTLPRMQLNPAIKRIEDFEFEDFTLLDYNPHPSIKAPDRGLNYYFRFCRVKPETFPARAG